MPTFVKDLLDRKGRDVVTVNPEVNIGEAASTLHAHKIGSVVVTDGDGVVLGIFTERDLVKAVAGQGAASLQQSVSVAMTKNVIRCHHDSTTDELMEIMTGGRFRHVPVEENGRLAGIISIGDVVKARLSELSMEKDALEGMIKGY